MFAVLALDFIQLCHLCVYSEKEKTTKTSDLPMLTNDVPFYITMIICDRFSGLINVMNEFITQPVQHDFEILNE